MPRPLPEHGGKREGSGRKRIHPEPTFPIRVPLSFFYAYRTWVKREGNKERFRLALYKLRDMMERENNE